MFIASRIRLEYLLTVDVQNSADTTTYIYDGQYDLIMDTVFHIRPPVHLAVAFCSRTRRNAGCVSFGGGGDQLCV